MVSTTIITPGGTTSVDAEWVDGSPSIPTSLLDDATGWALEPSGFCRGDLCVPNRGEAGTGGRIELAAVAAALDAPILFDEETPAVVMGEQREQRTLALQGAQLPSFQFPDLAGAQQHSAQWANKKKVLVVFASW
ncbi:MAG: hypothetical protein R2754_16275 [Microthrixaceae bacterium]